MPDKRIYVMCLHLYLANVVTGSVLVMWYCNGSLFIVTVIVSGAGADQESAGSGSEISTVKIHLNFKRFIFDAEKRMIQ